jgi:hypothetical protein
MYDVGTWVKVAHWDFRDWIGYVVKNNPMTKEYLIRITIAKWGYPVKPEKVIELEFHEDYLYEIGIESGYDTSFLKDLALDWSLVTWNEELFNELMGGNEHVER